MIDIQLGWIADGMRYDLGRWLSRREKLIKKRLDAAQKDLLECGWPLAELERLWNEQRAKQTTATSKSTMHLFPTTRY
jgi:hypothetical protein